MDKKLLLTIQWACAKKGIKLPWDVIGHEMGETITEGAVIQHLSKLRQRMVADELPVPPALSRGGRNTQVQEKKGPAKRVTKRTTNKKKTAEESDEESDVDQKYSPEGDLIGSSDSHNKKKKRKTATKRAVKKESGSPQRPVARDDTPSDDEENDYPQHYAIGDSMWDLGLKADTPYQGTPSGSSDASAYHPTMMVALKVAKERLAGLGSPGLVSGNEVSAGQSPFGARNRGDFDEDTKKMVRSPKEAAVPEQNSFVAELNATEGLGNGHDFAGVWIPNGISHLTHQYSNPEDATGGFSEADNINLGFVEGYHHNGSMGYYESPADAQENDLLTPTSFDGTDSQRHLFSVPNFPQAFQSSRHGFGLGGGYSYDMQTPYIQPHDVGSHEFESPFGSHRPSISSMESLEPTFGDFTEPANNDSMVYYGTPYDGGHNETIIGQPFMGFQEGFEEAESSWGLGGAY